MPFADASFLIAFLDAGDQWHALARGASPDLMKKQPWRTHTLALAEIVAVIGSRRGGKAARSAFDFVRDTMEIIEPSLADLDEAMIYVVKHDGKLSLADGLFVVYARHAKDTMILSFDSDFDSAGLDRRPARGKLSSTPIEGNPLLRGPISRPRG